MATSIDESTETGASSKRWGIAIVLTAAIAISYLDRQTLSLAIKAIQSDIPITNTQFGRLAAAFLFAYGVMYAAGGRLVDALGTKRGFLVVMVFWSLACASHGFATSVAMLVGSRVLLGMGEGGGFPAVTRAVSEWFAPRERATAMGMINSGTAVGSVIAPPLIALIIGSALGWRWVFFITGAFGLLWAAWWWRVYDVPSVSVAAEATLAEPAIPWTRLLMYRETWGLVGAKFLSDAAWFFYTAWLPKYLYDVRGFDTKAVGYYAWIPYAFAGLGALTGGWLSSRLLSLGRGVNASRKIVLGVSAAVMPLIALVTHSPVQLAIVLFSIAFLGQQSWSTLVMIVPTDLFPRRVVGSVAGLVGFGGAMGGVVFNLIVGYMLDVQKTGYGPIFAMVSTFHVLAFLLILATVRDIRPLTFARAT